MTLHPAPAVDINRIQCPVCGELRFGASLARVNAIRQQAALNFQDNTNSIPDGTPLDLIQESPTCGTVRLHFVKGQNDQDGLPTIVSLSQDSLPVPCRGSRRFYIKSTDQAGVGSSATDVDELGITVKAGDLVRFRALLGIATSAASIGAMVSVNGPAASLIAFQTEEWTSASASVKNTQLALDAFSSQTASNGSAVRFYTVEGVAQFTAAGTLVPRVKAESGGTLTVYRGSFIELDRI